MNINSVSSSPAFQQVQRPVPQTTPNTAGAKTSEEASESAQARAQEASKAGGIDTYA